MKALTLPGVFLLLLVPALASAQPLGRRDADRFVRDLLWQRDSLASWFDPAGLASSHRFGIVYEGVDHKILIACDVGDSVRGRISREPPGYSLALDTVDERHALLTLTLDRFGVKNRYYFEGNRCVSTLAYLARKWSVVGSDFFRFHLGDSSRFNTYCIAQLESFVRRMAGELQLTDQDLRTLRDQKIDYYLCRDESEIERLTGYRARGMYNLAYDAIVSTYPAHFHELTHLLVNFKLRRLPLYTHPFLQEGVAVACGGRGGMEPGVLLSLGSFLFRSGFVDDSTLLDKKEFGQLDASLTYPASALYTRYLIGTMGMGKYLELYRTHSGVAGDPAVTRITADELGGDSAWQSYVRMSASNEAIAIDHAPVDARLVLEDPTTRVTEDSARYYFQLSGSVLVPSEEVFPTYRSRKFEELFPGKTYRGEKYLIRVNEEEVAVYNLFTDNLLASYAASFTIPPKQVPRSGGRFSFSIEKRLFDEPIKQIVNADESAPDREN